MDHLTDVIKQVTELTQNVDDALDKMDKLLTPICTKAMKEEDHETIEFLIKNLPMCFWRTELRTWVYSKK